MHEYDCRFIMQLSHGGRQRDIPGIEYPKGLSSTGKSDPLHGFECERMTVDDIQATVQAFAAGARARQGSGPRRRGIARGERLPDHAVPQLGDQRPPRRLRRLARRIARAFVLEIVAAIRKEVGADFHLQVKISATEYNNAMLDLRARREHGEGFRSGREVAGGRGRGRDPRFDRQFLPPSQEPGRRFSGRRRAEDVSRSCWRAARTSLRNYLTLRTEPAAKLYQALWNHARGETIEGISLDDSRQIKAAVGIPVICTGGFQTASFIRQAIESGGCDAVSIARPLIANNDLVQMFAAGADRAPLPCTYCNKCLVNVLRTRWVVTRKAASRRVRRC